MSRELEGGVLEEEAVVEVDLGGDGADAGVLAGEGEAGVGEGDHVHDLELGVEAAG
jgi:hypothetical protein